MQIGYLDPASGSIIASALVGGVAAIGVAARSARGRIKGVFKRSSGDEAAEVEEPTTSAAPDVAVDADA